MKIGIIGLGGILNNHLENLHRLGLSPACVCDISQEKIDKVCSEYHCSGYLDYKEMIEIEHPDVVHILTPHYLHKEMTIFCLKHNVNVICEKPMALDYQEALEINSLIKQTDLQIAYCFQNRYNLVNRKLKEICDQEEVVSLKAEVNWHREKEYYISSPWRGIKAQAGGGVLITQAIHTLNLIEWFLGEPISVSAKGNYDYLNDIIDVENTIHVDLFYQNILATLDATITADKDYPVKIIIETKSNTYIAYEDKILDKKQHIVAQNTTSNIVGKDYYGNGHYNLIKDFYECISSKRSYPINQDVALPTMKLITQIYSSIKKF